MALEALFLLASDNRKVFLVEKFMPEFLRYAFGECFCIDQSFFECENLEAIIASDYYTNGSFFKGLVACNHNEAEALHKVFSDSSSCNFLRIAVNHIDKIHFFARRLFDDSCDWFSGEYEILTTKLTKEGVVDVLKSTAKKFNAQYWEIERPFYYRLFKQPDIF